MYVWLVLGSRLLLKHKALVQSAHTWSAVPLCMSYARDGHIWVNRALHVSFFGRAVIVLVALSQLTTGAT